MWGMQKGGCKGVKGFSAGGKGWGGDSAKGGGGGGVWGGSGAKGGGGWGDSGMMGGGMMKGGGKGWGGDSAKGAGGWGGDSAKGACWGGSSAKGGSWGGGCAKGSGWGDAGMMMGGMKGKGKDKGKGKGKRGPSGPNLTRTRITSDPVTGEVAEWKGKFGWVTPTVPMEHPQANPKHKGNIFVSMTDLQGGLQALTPGSLCQFHVFADSSGLGGEEVIGS